MTWPEAASVRVRMTPNRLMESDEAAPLSRHFWSVAGSLAAHQLDVRLRL
jgi:hypothetical protein